MADISQIVLLDGNTYNFKDASARASIPDKIDISEKGSANGVAELDSTGKVPTSQLPSYVDDVIEYASYNNFPSEGEFGKIYVDTTTNFSYRWSGTTYIRVDDPGIMTGATSSASGSAGLVPTPHSTDVDLFLSGDGTWKPGGKPMVILSYGNSTWQEFMDAYTNNIIVYCRASSNANPASGSQTRMAFMAYVSNAENPTNVEFQYYRSVSTHSATQQGDQVYIYKLDKSKGWTVTVREAMSKIAVGANMSSSYRNGTITLSADTSGKVDISQGTENEGKILKVNSSGNLELSALSDLPAVTASDNGKILCVVNGAWALISKHEWLDGNY